MAKRGLTKNQGILNDARDRRDQATWAVKVAESALQTAQAVALAYGDTYDALDKSLAPKPRGGGAGKLSTAPAPVAGRKSRRGGAGSSTATNSGIVIEANDPISSTAGNHGEELPLSRSATTSIDSIPEIVGSTFSENAVRESR